MDSMKAQELVQTYRDLESAAQPWRQAWSEIAEYCQPRRHHDMSKLGMPAHSNAPDMQVHDKLFESTGTLALDSCAKGFFSWTTPRSRPWFSFAAPAEVNVTDAGKSWLSKCTEITRRKLIASNFYNTIFETHLDRTAFGTACLGGFIDGDRFRFRTERDYVCCEGKNGEIDTVIVRRIYSHRTAAKEFGIDNLPPAIRKDAQDPLKWNQTSEYIHGVYPNEDATPNSPLERHAEWMSHWVHLESQHEIRKIGSWYQPYSVTRFLTWSNNNPSAPYGWSPAWLALPELRQLNKLEMLLDSAVDVLVNPRILEPYNLDGRVDFRPGGITVIPEDGAKPEEWLTQSRPDFGHERAELKRQRVQKAFMVDLFEMFGQLDNPKMTAAEVYARLGERIDNGTPAFDLFHVDCLEPKGQWFFQALARARAFPRDVPRELLFSEDPAQKIVHVPAIEFSSRIAMEQASQEETQMLQALSQVLPLAQFDEEIAVQADLPKFVREFIRKKSGGDTFLRDEQKAKRMMQAIRDERMRMAQAQGQQQMQQAA